MSLFNNNKSDKKDTEDCKKEIDHVAESSLDLPSTGFTKEETNQMVKLAEELRLKAMHELDFGLTDIPDLTGLKLDCHLGDFQAKFGEEDCEDDDEDEEDFCDCDCDCEVEETLEITPCPICDTLPSVTTYSMGSSGILTIKCEGCNLEISGDVVTASSAWSLRNLAIEEALINEIYTSPCAICGEEVEPGEGSVVLAEEQGRAHMECFREQDLTTALMYLGVYHTQGLIDAFGDSLECFIQPTIGDEDEDD